MCNKALFRALCFLVMLSVATPAAVVAQESSPPPLAEMWVFTLKAGHSIEFFAGLKAHVAFRVEHGDPRTWLTYAPLLGDRLDRIAVRYCCFAWADVDAYRQWEAGNPEVQTHFDEHVAPHVESFEHDFEAMDWVNSHWSEAKGPYQLFAVTEFSVDPAGAAEFDAAREKMSQIAIEQGWASDDNVWLWASSIGGSPRHSIILPHRNFASLDSAGETFPQFLASKLGSAEAAEELLGRFRAATTGSDFQIWEYRAELSMPESD